jgi:hypothetical protein
MVQADILDIPALEIVFKESPWYTIVPLIFFDPRDEENYEKTILKEPSTLSILH